MKWKAIAVAVGAIAALALVITLAVTRGPLAPVQVTIAEVKHAAVKLSVFGIGTVEARLAYSYQ